MKPFKTIDEQIEILRGRNLKFKNIDRAKRYLLDYNYYNVINFYSKFFMNKENNTYYDDIYFENILEVHHFDKEIKTAIFEAIMEVERHFKSILAYDYCSVYKDDLHSYLNIDNYNKKYQNEVQNFIDMLNKLINKYKKKKDQNSIKHYANNHAYIPFWIIVDYLTLGNIIYFYKIINIKEKNLVAAHLSFFIKENLETDTVKNVSPRLIGNALENIRELRNITAHNKILLGFKFKNDLPFYEDLNLKYNMNKIDNRQNVYCTILYLQFFLSHNQYANLNNKIRKRINNLKKKIPKEYFDKIILSLGFPENLEKIQLKSYTDLYPDDLN